MTREIIGAVLIGALLVLAGCTGGASYGDGTTPADAATPTDVAAADGGETGTVSIYVSDEKNAIGAFAHLNVTITKVGLHRVESANGSETATPANDTTPATTTATAPPTATATVTATPPPTTTDGTDAANATATTDDEATGETEDGDGEQGTEAEESEEKPEGEEADDGEDGQWIENETSETVDLTRLVGDNATALDVIEAPPGTYDTVFLYVSSIDATLENGKSVNVKLPSERLHITKQFQVRSGENVSFVFDISVHKAGKSGTYILKPVVSQSGADQAFEDVDDEDDQEEEETEDREDDPAGEDDEPTATPAAKPTVGEDGTAEPGRPDDPGGGT